MSQSIIFSNKLMTGAWFFLNYGKTQETFRMVLDNLVDCVSLQNSAEMLEGTQAAFILLRSFLHSLSTDRAECVHHLMCRGAGEAAQLGPIGGIVSELSRYNI